MLFVLTSSLAQLSHPSTTQIDILFVLQISGNILAMTAAMASDNSIGSVGSKSLKEQQYQLLEICDRLGRLQQHLGDLRMDLEVDTWRSTTQRPQHSAVNERNS